MRADHVVFNGRESRAECGHCGATEAFELPMRVDAFVARTDAFVRAHRDCLPLADETCAPEGAWPRTGWDEVGQEVA